MPPRVPSRILIGVLSCGENEREACLASIRAQDYPDFELLEIAGQPNKEAHEGLYRAFMARAGDCGAFLKMDADMVFAAGDSLRRFAERMAAVEGTDVLMIDVFDWYSQICIPSQIMYSNRVVWEGNPDPLFVDYHGVFPGAGRRERDPEPPLTLHSPDPSPYQAFSFGLHRALKFFQPHRAKGAWALDRALVHWIILHNVWHAYRRLGDVRRLHAIAGATFAEQNLARLAGQPYRSDALRRFFEERILPLSEDALVEKAGPLWSNPLHQLDTHLARVQPAL